QSFSYPAFAPSPHAPRDIKPPMYRPFRWGEYHVTMGIRSMQWGEWIELDDQYDAYHRIRKDRIACKGREAVDVLPPSLRTHDGADAPVRLVHELAEYLSRRYPTTFCVTRHASSAAWGGAPPVQSVRIVPLQQEYGVDALRIAALLVQDDLAVMVEGSDGGYYFQGGAICVPGFWRMKDKLGMRLDEIHLSGRVPQYQEKLHTSLERFFRRLTVDKPVVRNNYFVQIAPPDARNAVDPDELAWGETVLGSEDDYGGGKGAYGGSDGAAPDARALVVSPQTLRLRTERQTLRRLPRSGAVVFTIRTYLVPLEALVREPGVAARFASAVRSWPDGVQEYKGERRYGEVLLRFLDEVAEKEKEAEASQGEVERKPYPF
ncbi:hypothetical protein B0H10DRAFT_1784043, partial [Mycena sp. CBHHK59/15]